MSPAGAGREIQVESEDGKSSAYVATPATGRLMMGLEIERAGRDLGAAVDALRCEPGIEGSRVGCLGFCMGACRAKVLGVFAENDDFISSADVQKLEEALAGAGVEAKPLTYVGVQHAFLNDARPDVFDAETSAQAWRDIETFLEAELR